MKLSIRHLTRYGYTEPVSTCHSILHLKPRNGPHQRCLSSQLQIAPAPVVVHEHEDFFGNRVNYFSIQQSHEALEVIALSEVEVERPRLPAPDSTPAWEVARDCLHQRRKPAMNAARVFTLGSPLVPLNAAARDFAAVSFTRGRPILEATIDFMGRIYTEFAYDPSFSTISTPLAEVIAHRRGVCQDFAHLAISGLRGLGLATRYVSGYLETMPPPGQAKLQGSDASHAWFSILIPDFGWVDCDPTNNQIPGEQHITTAVGRDYQDVTPMRGIFYGGGGHDLTVAVDVNRITA